MVQGLYVREPTVLSSGISSVATGEAGQGGDRRDEERDTQDPQQAGEESEEDGGRSTRQPQGVLDERERQNYQIQEGKGRGPKQLRSGELHRDAGTEQPRDCLQRNDGEAPKVNEAWKGQETGERNLHRSVQGEYPNTWSPKAVTLRGATY